MSDVSQPDLWMEIHNPEETADERYRHFFFLSATRYQMLSSLNKRCVRTRIL